MILAQLENEYKIHLEPSKTDVFLQTDELSIFVFSLFYLTHGHRSPTTFPQATW